MPDQLSAGAVLLAPVAVVLYLAFSAGGFFAGTTAVAALILLAVLAVRILTGRHPVAGANLWVLVASASLAGLGAWILLSYLWSDSASRALLEFDRVLVYLAAFLLVALRRRSERRVQALVWAIGIAIAVIVGAGLLSRILPEVFPVDTGKDPSRLSHPLTYWNAVGITAGFGIILALTVASDRRQPRVARPLAAALIVPLAAALLFSFSRGAIVATVLGIAVFALVGRPRGLVTTVLAVAPPLAVALVACYQADALASADFASPEGVDQGRNVALFLLAATAAAGILQALLIRFDGSLTDLRLPESARRPALVAAGAAVVAALTFSVAVLDAPGAIGEQVDRFLEGGDVQSDPEDQRTRLTDVSNNRAHHWRAAVDSWKEHTLVGNGAGTFVLLWAEKRSTDFTVIDAHSLYLETLAELGLVGLLLLLVAVGTLLVGTVLRCRGPDRALYAGVLAVIAAWAAHAGIDWDWELPAVTLIPFALGGAALAGSRPRVPSPKRLVRVMIGIGLLITALTPFSIAVSQARLDASVDAIREGDCARTIDRALDSIDALSPRPEPFELLAYCNARAGRPELAERMAREGIERDPRNWEFHYDLALVRAVAGNDPRGAVRRARELNPLDGRVRELERRLRTDDAEQWRAAGRTAPLLLP